MPNDITKPNKQIIEAAGGYDGIVSLIQTKGISPMVILENSEVGEFGFLPEGFLRSSQSLWVMKMVANDEDRQRVQKECMSMTMNLKNGNTTASLGECETPVPITRAMRLRCISLKIPT